VRKEGGGARGGVKANAITPPRGRPLGCTHRQTCQKGEEGGSKRSCGIRLLLVSIKGAGVMGVGRGRGLTARGAV
jgi:hypothetical protein